VNYPCRCSRKPPDRRATRAHPCKTPADALDSRFVIERAGGLESAIDTARSTAMKGDAKVIEFLNKALYNELIAINQYFLHAKMLKNWGLKELAEHEYHESIDEMKHADKLSERILFLEGLPNFQNLGKLRIGENPREVLTSDLALELEALPMLREGIIYCESIKDIVSRQLLADILESEEEHIDWIETQLSLMDRLGEQNYLSMKIES
jgi:bacterioferritin